VLLEIITRREVQSALTVQKVALLVKRLRRGAAVFEAIAAFLIALSVGILIARAMDAFRPCT
jgi:hypothetical protein